MWSVLTTYEGPAHGAAQKNKMKKISKASSKITIRIPDPFVPDVMANQPCGKLFEYWVNIFRNERGLFGIRCVQTNRVWRSDDAMKLFGEDSNFGTWGNPLRNLTVLNDGDIQAAQSRALKLGGSHFCTVLFSDASAYDFMTEAKHCGKCPMGSCSVLLYCAAPR